MRAVVYPRYGPPDVLQIRDLPTPEPTTHEVLVKVHSCTVNRTDCGMYRPKPWFVRLVGGGLLRPRYPVPGMDFAGEVEAVGAAVRLFRPGDRVFGMSPDVFGAQAEYLVIGEDGPIAAMPASTSFAEAVVCEGAWYAYTNLQGLRVGPGHRILVYGASGAIGTAAVQLARAMGAEVTAVVATRHLELAARLGAQHVVDYTATNFARLPATFDSVFDAVGKTSYFTCRGLLKARGVFAATDLGPWGQNPLLALWSSITGSHRVIFPLPQRHAAPAVVRMLKARMESGEFRAVIDRRVPLVEIADAYRYVQTEQKTGIVVVDVVAPT